MKNNNIESFLGLLIVFNSFNIISAIPFCHISCVPNRCDSASQSACKQCHSGFIKSTLVGSGFCNFDSTQSVLALSLQTSNFTIVPSIQSTCATYSFYGKYSNNSIISIASLSPIIEAHYQVKLVLWVILIDQWKTAGATDNDYLTVKYINSNLSAPLQSLTVYANQTNTTEQVCTLAQQKFIRISFTFSHTDVNNNLGFQLNSRISFSSSSWGLGDIWLISKLCSENCSVCTGPSQNQCSQCDSGFLLSGTYCGVNCLQGYGLTTLQTSCIVCHEYCIECYGVATNCSTCYTSIIDNLNVSITVYQIQDLKQCKNICPSAYFQFTQTTPNLTNKCLLCANFCTALNINAQFQTVENQSLIFIFEFSNSMNFTAFSYLDFVDVFIENSSALSIASDFTISQQIVNNSSFMIKITPNSDILKFTLQNVCIKTKAKQNNSLIQSLEGYKLSDSVYQVNVCEIWSYIKLQSQQQQTKTSEYSRKLTEFNNVIRQFTTQIGTQQIVKSGLFTLLMPGAQLSSTLLLHISEISQDLYESTRLFGSFVYFQVPPYKQEALKQKYVFSIPDNEVVQTNSQRRLLGNSSIQLNQWKFQRTGFTGFFIIDCYLQLIFIGVCWILKLIAFIVQKKTKITKAISYGFSCKINAIFHKIHQISMFYLIIASLIQYRNFTTSTFHSVSFIISVLALIYYLIYELKIYYDMQQCPYLKLGTKGYKHYIKLYSYFLAYYRFQEYKDKAEISFFRRIIRPYNFHTLTFVKKALMLLGIIIFYQFSLAQIILLSMLQFLDVIRYIFTQPYHNQFRNIYYLIIEVSLLGFFICSLINQTDLKNQSIQPQISSWISIIFLLAYNVLYIVSTLVQCFIILCDNSLSKMAKTIRKKYYEELLDHFDQYGNYYRLVSKYTEQLKYCYKVKKSNTFKDWINGLHHAEPIVDLSKSQKVVLKDIINRGYLWEIYQQQNQEDNKYRVTTQSNDQIRVKIQSFKITQIQYEIKTPQQPKINPMLAQRQQKSKDNTDVQYKSKLNKYHKQVQSKSLLNQIQKNNCFSFMLSCELIPQIIKINPISDSQRKHYSIPKKIKRQIHSSDLAQMFQSYIAERIFSFLLPDTIEIILNTWIKINMSFYKPGQSIKMRRQNMYQQIYVIQKDNKKVKKNLDSVMDKFPVNWNIFENHKGLSINNDLKEKGHRNLRISV